MVRILHIFQNDQQLLKAIREGNDSALAYLYEKNIRIIMKYVLQNNGTEREAAELLQDALVVLWEKTVRGEFSLSSKLSTYIFGIARNMWLRELSRRKKLTILSEIHQPSDDINSSSEQLENEELLEIVKKGMKKLSDLCKQILIKFYFEEKSMMQIGQELGLANEDVAKSKKYQCKKELQRLIENVVSV